MCCGADTFVSREPRGWGPQPALGLPTSASVLDLLNFRGRKGSEVIKSNLPLDRYKNQSPEEERVAQSTTCTTVLFSGNLAPNLENCLGRRGSRKDEKPQGASPANLTPPHCSHAMLRVPGSHMARGTSTVIGSKSQAKWLLPAGYPTISSLADSP